MFVVGMKGPGSIKSFFGHCFSKNLNGLILCGSHSHNKDNMPKLRHAQTSVCMFTIAMDTPPYRAKMPFFHNFRLFLRCF